ncbi:hypothetical protein OTB20_07400 [Streptomyces sp. H27-H1]|uniref:hypothetical protein n=1 Tax=Streptomyces sp. H27-H1 TaxID=2996461 RepID=UPI00227132C0|nr:hypothetical protein [Streptomyces sp. H27-H1]MCY0926036.1 hypothetical protein [Streptomyces sp. H27-H1]
MPPHPQNTPRWDPAAQRWVTEPPAPGHDPGEAPAPAPGHDPDQAPGPAPGHDPVPGPAAAPAPGPDPAPAPGYGPAPGYDPIPGPAPASGPRPAPAYDPAVGPAPAPGYDPGPAPQSGPQSGPGGYGPAVSPQDPYAPQPRPYPQPVLPAYPDPPRPERPRGRWLTPATAAVAVAALAIGAAAVWFVQRDSGEPAHAGPTASSAPPSGDGPGTPAPSATGTPSQSQTGAGTASPTPSPSGSDPARETVRDAKGFTVAVPAGWVREDGPAGVFYRSPDRTALIQIFQVSEPELTPLAAVQGASSYLRAQTTGYQEIGVGPAPDAPEGGELVYEYDSAESHGRRRSVERVFVAEDGKKWAVLTAGPAAGWTLTQAHHRAALDAFRPTGG